MPDTYREECLALTEFEAIGLRSPLNLADGHSYVNPEDFFPKVSEELSRIWTYACRTPIPAMENEFKATFADFYNLVTLSGLKRFAVCPTASNSIDLVGAYLASVSFRVGLVEPTFDNLALLLNRRNVPLVAISEHDFFDIEKLHHIVESHNLQSLFIVNPNNPTGLVCEKRQLELLIELALSKNLLLIIDSSFRFARCNQFDDYELLERSGVKFIVIEDTGKIWPTMDTKASLLCASRHCWNLLRQIYDEVFLCTSNFSLALITEFIRSTVDLGGFVFVQDYLLQRKNLALRLLKDSTLNLAESDSRSVLSFLWLDCSATGLYDIQLTSHLQQRGISVLPGRYFYWSSHERNGHNRIRISLMKPLQTVVSGIQLINSGTHLVQSAKRKQ